LDTLATKPLDRLSSKQQQKLGIHLTTQHNTPLAFTTITNYGLIETSPTESRMRQKAKEQHLKDAGQTVARKRRTKIVEKGSDDMGECIDTLPVDDAVDAYYDGGLSGNQPHEHADCADPDMEMFLTSIEADLTPYHCYMVQSQMVRLQQQGQHGTTQWKHSWFIGVVSRMTRSLLTWLKYVEAVRGRAMCSSNGGIPFKSVSTPT